MPKKYSHFILWLLLNLVAGTPLQGQDLKLSKIPLVQVFSTEQYQGGIQNWNITHDDRGILYVANNYGILAFDGRNWRAHPVQENTKVRSVHCKGNRVYVGGQGQLGYFEPDRQGALQFYSLKELIPEQYRSFDDVWTIFNWRDKVVFSTVRSIFLYDEENIEVIPFSSPIGYAFLADERLYAQSMTDGIWVFGESQFESWQNTSFFNNKSIIKMAHYENGHMLIMTRENGLYLGNGNDVRPWSDKANEYLKGNTLNTLCMLNNGNIAIGSQNEGLMIFDRKGNLLHHLDKDKGLSNHTILSLHEDRLHNLWVGLNNGINYVELNSPFSLINEDSGLQGTGYTACLYKGIPYLGTSNGLFYQASAENDFSMVENSAGQVYNLSVLPEDLVLNHHLGAFEVNGGKAQPFFTETGTWKMVKHPSADRYLVGSYSGFYWFEKEGGTYVKESHVEQFRESSRIFEFEDAEHLWMTHGYKGAYRLDFAEDFLKPKISFYDEEKGFPSNILINVYPVRDALRFPAEQGIYHYESGKDRFVPDSSLSNMLGWDTHVSVMEEDELGNLFFISDRQAGLLRQNSLGELSKETAVFRRINQLLSDDLENISVLDYRNILFGAKDGFIHFDPVKVSKKPEEFPVLLREVYLFGQTDSVMYHGLESGKQIIPNLPYAHNSIGFRFAAPYFDSYQDINYRYRLVNFDDSWSSYGLAAQKEYTNLPAGDYRFEVQAVNIYGLASTLASYEFTIQPPWYATRMAYGIYAILALLPGIIIIRWMDRRHKKEKRALEEARKEQLKRKEDELHETTKKSEAEITQLRNEKLKNDISHKNAQLANTTMHLLNKNEFIVTIKNDLRTAISQDKNLSTEVKRIIKHIDRNISSDDDWKQFEMHFDQVHADFMKRIKEQYPSLTPQETKLAAFLRMNMTTKEIANLLHNSVRGVEISRYRLRKKLGIDRNVNLVDFMMQL